MQPAPEDSDRWMVSGEGHPRRWAILGVLIVSLLVVVLDNTILNIALPTIQRDLEATQGELVWAVDSYILVFAALLFTWGVLGDRYGRKRILVVGLIVFGLSSAACAFASTPQMLIGFRAVMGIGGAAVLPTTLAIITVVFPPHERGRAIGTWAGAVGAAVALGPVLGGALLQNPQWFAPLTWKRLGIGLLDQRADRDRRPDRHLEGSSGDAEPRRAKVGRTRARPVDCRAGVVGVRNHPRIRDPHVDRCDGSRSDGRGHCCHCAVPIHGVPKRPSGFDVSLFRNRGYAIGIAAVSLSFFALTGITFTLPFYLQILQGFDTLTAGLCFIPFAVGQLLAAPRSATTVARFGYRAVMTSGLVFVALALTSLVFVQIDTPLWLLLGVFFLFGLGMGLVIAPASTVMQNVLPLARAGAGSAVQNTVRQVGGALGVAIVGTVLATQYAANLATSSAELPDDVSQVLPEGAFAAASESIVATQQVLTSAAESGVPAAVIDSLTAIAYADFLAASHVTSVISASVVVIAALIVGFGLPHIPVPTKSEPSADKPRESEA